MFVVIKLRGTSIDVGAHFTERKKKLMIMVGSVKRVSHETFVTFSSYVTFFEWKSL